VNQLQQHAAGETATYAYYFTEEFKPDPPNPLWSMPDWLKTSADHGDEIPFMFGCTLIKKDMEKNDIWKSKAPVILILFLVNSCREFRLFDLVSTESWV